MLASSQISKAIYQNVNCTVLVVGQTKTKMSTLDSKAPLRTVKRVQFGIISPDEIVSKRL